MIPIFSRSGEVVQIYGRKISDLSQPLHLYLPGPHRGVFNEDAVRASKEVILCESLIDALTFWCAGFRNVTSRLRGERVHRRAPRRTEEL